MHHIQTGILYVRCVASGAESSALFRKSKSYLGAHGFDSTTSRSVFQLLQTRNIRRRIHRRAVSSITNRLEDLR